MKRSFRAGVFWVMAVGVGLVGCGPGPEASGLPVPPDAHLANLLAHADSAHFELCVMTQFGSGALRGLKRHIAEGYPRGEIEFSTAFAVGIMLQRVPQLEEHVERAESVEVPPPERQRTDSLIAALASEVSRLQDGYWREARAWVDSLSAGGEEAFAAAFAAALENALAVDAGPLTATGPEGDAGRLEVRRLESLVLGVRSRMDGDYRYLRNRVAAEAGLSPTPLPDCAEVRDPPQWD